MGPSSFFPYPGASPASAAELLFLPGRSDEDWAKILAHTETRRFTRGQVVMQAGEADRALLIVAEGYLEVLIPRRGGGALRRIATVEPGSIIGEVAFLDAGPRSATVRALTDGATLRLSFAAFEQL